MIRLQFVREPGLVSSTIAWFSAGHFSHVDAVVENRRWLLGSRTSPGDGVVARPADYGRFIDRAVYRVRANDRQTEAFWAFLFAQLGKPYDSTAIWAFAFNRDWRSPDKWFCSELQAAALEAAGIIGPVEANKIMPVELMHIVQAIGGIREG